MTVLEKAPVNVDEQRQWLNAHKVETGMSWPELGRAIDIAHQTLGLFGNGQYQGDNERIAKAVARYRSTSSALKTLSVEAPVIPGYLPTKTSARMIGMLQWAHRGRMVSMAGGPGLGKTMTIRHYIENNTAAFCITMTPSTAGVNNMQMAVLTALGDTEGMGTPQRMSARIRERVHGGGRLLIFDESQHISEKAMEEIRNWHDTTGVGIALFGNQHIINKLSADRRGASFAQLYSRLSMKLQQMLPEEDDVIAILDAWGVIEQRQAKFLMQRAMTAGGLRNITMILELANMLAGSEGRTMELADLRDAAAQLSHGVDIK